MDAITAITSQVPFLSAAIVLLRWLSVIPISNLQSGSSNQTFKFNSYKNNFYAVLAVLACGNFVVSQVAASGSVIGWIAFITGIAAIAVFELAIYLPRGGNHWLDTAKKYCVDDMLVFAARKIFSLRIRFADDLQVNLQIAKLQKQQEERLNLQDIKIEAQDYRLKECVKTQSDQYMRLNDLQEKIIIFADGFARDDAERQSAKEKVAMQSLKIIDYSVELEKIHLRLDQTDKLLRQQEYGASIYRVEIDRHFKENDCKLVHMGKKIENFEKKIDIEFTSVQMHVVTFRNEQGDFKFSKKNFKPEDLNKMKITHFDDLDEFCYLKKKTKMIQWTHKNSNGSSSKKELARLIMRYFDYNPASCNNRVICTIANYYFEINKNGKRLLMESKDVSEAKRDLPRKAASMGK